MTGALTILLKPSMVTPFEIFCSAKPIKVDGALVSMMRALSESVLNLANLVQRSMPAYSSGRQRY